jgi:hypothetical protein
MESLVRQALPGSATERPANKRLHLTPVRWQDGRTAAGEAQCSPDDAMGTRT